MATGPVSVSYRLVSVSSRPWAPFQGYSAPFGCHPAPFRCNPAPFRCHPATGPRTFSDAVSIVFEHPSGKSHVHLEVVTLIEISASACMVLECITAGVVVGLLHND
jgi:hypothetical protein